MKLAILTQSLQYNYGGLLQNYALQLSLKKMGHEVETIDWDSDKSIRMKLYFLKLRLLNLLTSHKVNYRPTVAEKAIIQRNTNYFIRNYIQRTKPMYRLKHFGQQAELKKYDGYIVGSDQCWRPCLNVFLPAMFLSFVKSNNVKRIAYAASFGTEKCEYSTKDLQFYRPLAQRFDCITVREDTAVKLCKEKFGVDALHVLDPTMLLKKEDYLNIINEQREQPSKGGLFNYVLDPSPNKTDLINRIAKELNLESFQVLPKCQAENRTRKDVKNNIEDCVFPSVTSWLRAFMDANMTIVDSFHGMVFSIIFNKPFWVIGNQQRGMSRFISLLKAFELEERLIDEDNVENIDFSKQINWGKINKLLEIKREKSLKILSSALK